VIAGSNAVAFVLVIHRPLCATQKHGRFHPVGRSLVGLDFVCFTHNPIPKRTELDTIHTKQR